MSDAARRRVQSVLSECARVAQMVEALSAGLPFPGEVALASHVSLRDDFDCSSREVDLVVERAMREQGVRGARLTGAGWGGCALVLGETDALAIVQHALAADYMVAFGHRPRGWIVTADEGARLEQ